MRFAYDDVPYDTEANSDTHPVALATLAHLAGIEAAPAAHSRVLEIGCGDGENLSAAATYLPNARFVGFDLAAAAIEAGKRTAGTNVKLFAGDILAVSGLGSFDYVIAHGLYSWVPEAVRSALLRLMRNSLGPHGIGFLSVNAMPGWEYRRALRELALDRTRTLTEPAERVKLALVVIEEIARGGKDVPGYFGLLAANANEYLAHIAKATPPEAPFSHYVFHDLLADCNDPFSVEELKLRLSAAGLRMVCETPLRTRSLAELKTHMASSGLPFLQILVQRDDAPTQTARDAADLYLWADFIPAGAGTFRTSTGAIVRPPNGSGLERATKLAPGFVRVRDLDPDPQFAEQVLAGFCDGVFTLRKEPPPATGIAAHVRNRAARALERGAASEVLTNAVHRSFRLPAAELANLDGESERLRRHLFIVDGS